MGIFMLFIQGVGKQSAQEVNFRIKFLKTTAKREIKRF